MAAVTVKASHVAAAQAVRDGGIARRDRTPITDCPYQVDGGVYDRFLARYWLKGWSRASR